MDYEEKKAVYDKHKPIIEEMTLSIVDVIQIIAKNHNTESRHFFACSVLALQNATLSHLMALNNGKVNSHLKECIDNFATELWEKAKVIKKS